MINTREARKKIFNFDYINEKLFVYSKIQRKYTEKNKIMINNLKVLPGAGASLIFKALAPGGTF